MLGLPFQLGFVQHGRFAKKSPKTMAILEMVICLYFQSRFFSLLLSYRQNRTMAPPFLPILFKVILLSIVGLIKQTRIPSEGREGPSFYFSWKVEGRML